MQTSQDTLTAGLIQAACKKALTSAAAGKFIAAAVQEALALAVQSPQGIVLAPMAGPLKVDYWERVESLEIESADGRANLVLYRGGHANLVCQSRAVWWGVARRLDADGNKWDSYTPHYVQDDFGQLVQVPA